MAKKEKVERVDAVQHVGVHEVENPNLEPEVHDASLLDVRENMKAREEAEKQQ